MPVRGGCGVNCVTQYALHAGNGEKVRETPVLKGRDDMRAELCSAPALNRTHIERSVIHAQTLQSP